MVVGGEQKTLGLGCMLLGTHQQGVPVILRELMLPDRSDPVTAIDQPLIDICTSCADWLDNALSHKNYKKRWIMANSGNQDACFVYVSIMLIINYLVMITVTRFMVTSKV
ncbi:unnamed protein product [Schistosoma mattheei]|uniref:Uncharacterized protein n=1 Tax=Schistosoma mattheei TaxID=31246 RepID=A0A183PP48_9TREM|nr:unnamed protein product [Schistosoma mattheei]